MPPMKMVKRRLTSVTTTKKIMKAMKMVAASKLQKDKTRLESARPFFDEARKTIDILRSREDTMENIFLKPREVKNTAYLVITSDRGLCGSFNINLLEKAMSHMSKGRNEKIIVIGLKGYDYFRRHNKNILHKYDGVLETAFYEDAERIAQFIADLYTFGKIDEVYVAYTQFKSVLTHIPRVEKILPLVNDPVDADSAGDMNYEPDISSYLDQAVFVYLSAFIYTALLESSSCEQAARMFSMDTAVNNASDILTKLTRIFNRRRQAAITQEISEIVNSTNISKVKR